jgi:hypothetical protein
MFGARRTVLSVHETNFASRNKSILGKLRSASVYNICVIGDTVRQVIAIRNGRRFVETARCRRCCGQRTGIYAHASPPHLLFV